MTRSAGPFAPPDSDPPPDVIAERIRLLRARNFRDGVRVFAGGLAMVMAGGAVWGALGFTGRGAWNAAGVAALLGPLGLWLAWASLRDIRARRAAIDLLESARRDG